MVYFFISRRKIYVSRREIYIPKREICISRREIEKVFVFSVFISLLFRIFLCMLTLLVDYFLSYLYSRLTQLNNIFNSG